MATFRIYVAKHQRRRDGKYPISIRLYWQKKISYIKTEFYATDGQINQKRFELKDVFLLNKINERIQLFEAEKQHINIYYFTAKKLAEYYEALTGRTDNIDFLHFGYDYCAKRRDAGRSYQRIFTTLNNLMDFTKGKLPINELTSKKLQEFENYLKTERKIVRINQHGQPIQYNRKPCSIHCIADYMSDIRTVFNAACFEYNDDDTGNNIIHHYPFKKYKIPQIPLTEKRNLTADEIRLIPTFESEQLRPSIARDIFLLSFYLVGMNTCDIFALKKDNYKNGRLTYNRQKTKGKRKDKALISIEVLEPSKQLIEKYKGEKYLFNFYQKYSNFKEFQRNINIGLKQVAQMLQIDKLLSTYYARHSWATIARNDCNISKSDIAECINHSTNTITDTYIAKDWSIIDRANKKVIDFVFCENSVKNFDK